MKKYFSISYLKENFYIIITMLFAVILRFVSLGYSDFQGDEIKALYLPGLGQNFLQYIMDQRKGPIQFVVTFLLKFLDPNYDNQLLMRLPFALAGLFAVYFFFKFVGLHFGKKIALYASMFFAISGFTVAFSRIVQYQSFTIFFMILSLYYFSLATKSLKHIKSGVFLGFLYWAVSLLCHYDGIFIAPLALYLFYRWFKNCALQSKSRFIITFVSLLASGVLLLSFYVPFVLSISEATTSYWQGRISGDVSGKISSSRYLFSVYHPIYVVHIYTILALLGFCFIVVGILSERITQKMKLPVVLQKFFTHTTDLMNDISKDKGKTLVFLAWLFLGVLFFEWFVYIPGTHIYVYMIPTFIVLAFGLVTLESLVFKIFEQKLMRVINFIGISILFVFLFAQSYGVYVDNSREYPWEEEKFLIWKFPQPSPIFHLSMFGFPYYRDWEGIRDFIRSNPEIRAYTTNERKAIARYYVGLEKGADLAGFYVHIKSPQSFSNDIMYDKAVYWVANYEPVFTLTRFGRDYVRIYIMEPGTIEEIKQKGF